MGRFCLVFAIIWLTGCVSAPSPVVTPTNPNRPMAIHTCVPGAEVWLDGDQVPALRGTTDANGNIEFLVFPATIGAFNVHATAPKHQQYGAVITMTPSPEPLIVILGSCAS